ncbi:uncharacterized protein [Nicotiana tomentosiformis]|uniref:uncharacterized protein n=1 Tax=Nicotiana tomentosiformis TaxID=4098 RepID=UPI00388CD07D
MLEEDKLHNYISGMQEWAQNELRRQNVKDLPSAIAAADSLVDYHSTRSLSEIPSTSKPKKNVEKKGEWRKEVRKEFVEKGKSVAEGFARNRGNANKKGDGCWTCGGSHIAKNYPNRERVNALLASENNREGEGGEVAALVNPLRLINVITLLNATNNETNPHSLLMHIEMKLGEKSVIAMVDTGAIHTFVSTKLVQKYRLNVSKCPSYMKIVNAKAQAIMGMAYNVPMSIGYWKGKANLMVIPLEDFEAILGIDFMRKYCFVSMPHLDGVMIMHEMAPSFVKVIHPYGKEETQQKDSLVSAMMVEKGLKRGDETFLALMVEVKTDVQVEVPNCVAPILSDFADMMPPKLPRNLPPRRAIDHKIELLPGSVAPAQPPYRMAPKELAE